MGFKIRNKNLFWTNSGYKNNYEIKGMSKFKSQPAENYIFNINRYDTHSYMRLIQHYRNYSRTIKQYLYGNKELEEIIILELKSIFFKPFTTETPVDKIPSGFERRCAEVLDRDLELLSYNYHPEQLFTYELVNKNMREVAREAEALEKGEDTELTVFKHEVEKEIEMEKKRTGEEQVSIDKMSEIILRVGRSRRVHLGQKPDRNQSGDFNDYLEKRRPFVPEPGSGPSS